MTENRAVPATLACCLALVACTGESPVGLDDAGLEPAAVITQAITETPFTATDLPLAPVDPGVTRVTPSQIVIHGLTVAMRVDATDPRLSGAGQVVANGVLDPLTGSGPVWGTFYIDADQGGRWTGNWHGHRAPAGQVWVADIEWTGRGVSGPVEGLHLKASETITSPSIVPSGYVGAVQGVIRSH
jgi:hypothetical protein